MTEDTTEGQRKDQHILREGHTMMKRTDDLVPEDLDRGPEMKKKKKDIGLMMKRGPD